MGFLSSGHLQLWKWCIGASLCVLHLLRFLPLFLFLGHDFNKFLLGLHPLGRILLNTLSALSILGQPPLLDYPLNFIFQFCVIICIVVVTLVEMLIFGLVGTCRLLDKIKVIYPSLFKLCVSALVQDSFPWSFQGSICVKPWTESMFIILFRQSRVYLWRLAKFGVSWPLATSIGQ